MKKLILRAFVLALAAVMLLTSVSFAETLRKGDKGAAVERLTARLKELGYISKVTDKFDDRVETAVSLFQSTNGLSANGKADKKTQELLFSVSARPYGSAPHYPTLVRGDRGFSLIYTLQQRLKDLGYYTIKVDGIFGSGTQRAVREFQKMNGLAVTGKADDATQRLLYSSAAAPRRSCTCWYGRASYNRRRRRSWRSWPQRNTAASAWHYPPCR